MKGIRPDGKAVIEQAVSYNKKRSRKKLWYRIVSVLSAFVVFVTTYALILPAITLTDDPVCGKEEHTHTDECFASGGTVEFTCTSSFHTHSDACYSEGVLTCKKADFVIHTHSDLCFDENNKLICPLPEIEAHTHSSSCYEAVAENEITTDNNESNTAAEEKTEAVTEEKTTAEEVTETAARAASPAAEETTAEKVTEEVTQKTATPSDTTVEETSASEAAEPQLIEEPETEKVAESSTEKVTEASTEKVTEASTEKVTETSTEAVTERQTEKVTEPQTSAEADIKADATDIKTLVCTKKEISLHSHKDACFNESGELICEKTEISEHTHTEECIKSSGEEQTVCTLEEHTHDEVLCFADNTADVETAEEWEKDLPEKLTNDYAYDLVLIALSQLDYTESSRNVETDDEGRLRRYSRYGAWSGDAYCEWQEEFVSFCLTYAGIPEEEFPQGKYAYTWEKTLGENEILRDINDYTPKTGDLVFIKNNGETATVGILAEIDSIASRYVIIEGNTDKGAVEKKEYDFDSVLISSFAEIPSKDFLCETAAHIHSDACLDENNVTVCNVTEHCHTDECLGLYPLTEREREQVDMVLALIDEMPTADEIDETLLAFEDADDMDGYQDYFIKVGQQGKAAYSAYSLLNEKQKAYIKNIDKLMESSYLWSQVNLAATAAARVDDVKSVAGDGIKIQLFNYSNHINKTADHKSWRPIASYFTFRNSSTTAGATPSDTTIVPSWNINSDHDIDGFTKTHATVERVLTANGTPVLDLTRNADGTARVDPGVSRDVRDLSYLFSNTGDPDVSVYSPTNTFLQKNGNYYWYDSALNAVDYDVSANVIRLRSYVERNSTTAGYTTKYGDFTPFNYTNGEQIGLDADGVTPYHILSADVDYWFGMSMEVNFFQTKDGIIDDQEMKFQFSGDDDVWVFVDDVLVLDLGGTHGTVDGSINFATGQVLQYLSWSGANSTEEAKTGGSDTSFPTTIRACFDAAGRTPNGGWNADGTTFADYSEHTLKIFYMERGSAVANCKLSFSLPALPDKSLTVTKDLVTDEENEVTEYIKDSLSYKFRVMKADSNGNSTGELFVKGGTSFDILENATKVGTGTVDTDGTFSIKAGQSAQFTEMLRKGAGHVNYVVEELLPENSTGQYSGVEYDVSGAGGETLTDDTAVDNFTAYRTGKLSAEQTQAVTYRNKIDVTKLSYLEISKEVAPNAVFAPDKVFNMQVTLGDVLLPIGTAYTINGEPYTVTTAGIIPLTAEQRAVLSEGILSGTEYFIKELNTVEENMLATYVAECSPTGTVTATANGVSGVVGPGSVIKVEVTNQNNDFSLRIPLSKQILDNDSTYNISIEAIEINPDTLEMIGDVPGAVIPVTGTSPVSGEINLGYTAGTTGTKYYKIFENAADNNFIYDSTFYILEVETTGSEAELISIKKNGTEPLELTSTLSFVNQKTAKLNVTKEVIQKLTDDIFEFTATVTLNGEPVTLSAPEEGAAYSIEGNVIRFSLHHGSSVSIPYIPYGAKVTVSELTTNGYIVFYEIAGVHTELQEGSSVTLDFESSDITVHFTNDAVYELPETGSSGTVLYTLGGCILIISALTCLLYRTIKRRKEDSVSF